MLGVATQVCLESWHVLSHTLNTQTQREQRMLFCSWWTSVFEGRAQGCYGKGIVELFILKYDVAQYILHEWASANMSRTSQVCIQKMIVIFSSVQSYRSHCGYPGKTMAMDSTWRAGWSSQMDELFTLVENVLFDQIFELLKNSC